MRRNGQLAGRARRRPTWPPVYDACMQVRVVAFASAAEALGAGEWTLELPAGAGLDELRERLIAKRPGLATVWPRLALAVDGTVVGGGAPLHDGAEVALLPPVSGGAPRGWMQEGALDPIAVGAAVQGPGAGAAVLFVGTVRDQQRGRGVRGIVYTAYRPMADGVLDAIAHQLEEAHPGVAVAIAHRFGELGVGEASIVIATAAAHREEAYAVNREALERVKREAPIWKRERYHGRR